MKTLKFIKDLFVMTILFFTLVILYGFRYNIIDEEIEKIMRRWFNENPKL